jgi:hypothetical protein
MPTPAKLALEDLLRSHQLLDGSLPRPAGRRLDGLTFRVAALDNTLGDLPRGHVSEIYGPRSSGRTGLALRLATQATREGALVAWVDPRDSFDPTSAALSGAELARLLWVRGDGRSHKAALASAGVLVESGLFELVVLDLADVPQETLRRLPSTTWLRLERQLEGTPSALVLLAAHHVFRGPGGTSFALSATGARWSGAPGPGHLLRGLGALATAWRADLRAARTAQLELAAASR